MTNKKKAKQDNRGVQGEQEIPDTQQAMPEDGMPEENLPKEEAAQAADMPDASRSADLSEALKKAENQRDEYLNMAQRVQADFENFKRRNQSVRADSLAEGKRDVIIDMLPVLDNLERALAAAQDDTSPLKSGLDMVYRQIMDLLHKMGVSEIDCYGKPFDPEEANAVMQVSKDDMEPGVVCDVMQKGYRMGERVLRYAMVQVVSES